MYDQKSNKKWVELSSLKKRPAASNCVKLRRFRGGNNTGKSCKRYFHLHAFTLIWFASYLPPIYARYFRQCKILCLQWRIVYYKTACNFIYSPYSILSKCPKIRMTSHYFKNQFQFYYNLIARKFIEAHY